MQRIQIRLPDDLYKWLLNLTEQEPGRRGAGGQIAKEIRAILWKEKRRKDKK